MPEASAENLFLKALTALLVICVLHLWSHVSEQKLVNPGVTVITWSQQTDVEDANRGSGQAWLPLIP